MTAVAYSLERARSGDQDEALHGLRELGPAGLPELQEASAREDDPVVRSLIVEVIWQQRQPSVISFLEQALSDPAPSVWKEALDGLVTLASAESIQVLQAAAEQASSADRLAWIEEALEQAANAMRPR